MSRADAALGGGDLSLHRLRQGKPSGERADHYDELVDQAVLVEVQEIASLDLDLADAGPEDERVVERSEIVKGFEFRKGEYVVVEPEESKKIEPRTAKAMEPSQIRGKDDRSPRATLRKVSWPVRR